MRIDYEKMVFPQWRATLAWENMPAAYRVRLGQFALHMYLLGQHTVSTIDEVKYDGRLVVLDDGTR